MSHQGARNESTAAGKDGAVAAFAAQAAAQAAVRHLFNGSISTNTRRAYASQLRRLDAWLGERALTDASLAEYVGWLYHSGVAAATATQAVGACRYRARKMGQPNPAGARTAEALAGFRRDAEALKRGRGQAVGISPAEAARMAAASARDGASLRGLRDAALIAVMSDAMLRVSEAAELRLEDIAKRNDGSGRIRIPQSKTDAEGEGRVLYLGPPTVRWLDAWRAAAGIGEGLAFRRIRRGGRVQAEGLSVNAIRLIVKARAEAVGIAGGRVSGQSLRIGMAQALAAAGASVVEMQLAGRWRSPQMPAHYARGERAGRNAVARLIYARAEGKEVGKAPRPGSLERRALRVAAQFEGAGNRAGKELAGALRGWLKAADGHNEPIGAGPRQRLRGRSGTARRDDARGEGLDVRGLLSALSDVAEAWRRERPGPIPENLQNRA